MFVCLFSYSEGKSHSEVCKECPMGIWRCCTGLCVRPDNLCSLPQVGFCASRILYVYEGDISKRGLTNDVYFVLCLFPVVTVCCVIDKLFLMCTKFLLIFHMGFFCVSCLSMMLFWAWLKV